MLTGWPAQATGNGVHLLKLVAAKERVTHKLVVRRQGGE